ncbi:MAG: flagellar assembly protein FliW [Gemmatimonadetes bacterium]|nr:flagellar assembly protein FliW [Gemmatimonadota bacterium]
MMTASVATGPVHTERRRRRRFHSQLLGDVIVPEEQVLQFADGLFGFAAQREWVMIAAGRQGWCWLHAVDHPALAFLLVDPFEAFPDFGVELTTQDLRALGVTSATQVGIFAIATLPLAADAPITVNLQGPVAIAIPTRRGRQLVMSDARFGSRAPLAAQVPAERTDTES